MKPRQELLLALVASLTGGACNARVVHPIDGGGDDLAAAAAPDLAPSPCDSEGHCAAGLRCHGGHCIDDRGPCEIDAECQGDTFCDCTGANTDGDGRCACVPWGEPPRGSWDPECRRVPYPLTEVVPPVPHCQYTADGVETSPLVGDLDGDGRPEIVFMTTGGGLHAMHGDDCSTVFDVAFEFGQWNASQLAIGDLDADGVPEIVGFDRSRRVAVFDNQGRLLASSQLPYKFTGGSEELGGVALVDLDNRAPPEIVLAGQVLRYTSKPKPDIKQLWVQSPSVPFWGALSAIADVDGDGRPEVLGGKSLWSGASGADVTPAPLAMLEGPGAYPAVADFNLDGRPDAVFVMAGDRQRRIAIFDFAGRKFLLGPFDAAEAWGGPPVVADFDGDGVPDVGVGGIDRFTAYSPVCAVGRPADKCDQTLPGVLWSRAIQDRSSGSSGASAFDFNGDGAFEIVFRDECWLRALDGRNGKALFAVPVTSATGVEIPVVADVDGDNHADIVVTSTGYPGCASTDDPETGTAWTGQTNGVLIYSDPKRKWMPARPVWNQHTYHVTNVNDDLTIPTRETPGWTVWNGYRQNEQGLSGRPRGLADLTARKTAELDPGPMDCVSRWTLSAEICNRGAGTVQRGVPGTFYVSDPRAGSVPPVCTSATTVSLAPGACQIVRCDYLMPPLFTGVDLWFRANDDGMNGSRREECRVDNDLLLLSKARCNQTQ